MTLFCTQTLIFAIVMYGIVSVITFVIGFVVACISMDDSNLWKPFVAAVIWPIAIPYYVWKS